MLKFQAVAEKTAKNYRGATFFAAPCMCHRPGIKSRIWCDDCFSDDGTIGPFAVEAKKEENSLEGGLVNNVFWYLAIHVSNIRCWCIW